MSALIFIASVVLTSAVSALIRVETGTSQASQPDYHFVPYAGDSFGA